MDFQFSRFEIITGTGSLFLCLLFVCVFVEAAAIQRDLTTAAASAVREAGLYWTAVEGRGQALVLTGAADDERARERAAAAAAGVAGVTSVTNHITVVGRAGTCQRPVNSYLEDRQVAFRAGRAELTPASLAVLAGLAGILRGCDAAFEIAGHTDAEGDAAINRKLSQRRAEAVARYLVQHGVAPERLTAVGYGERQPVSAADSAAGRAANHRVELRVLGATS